MKLKIMTYNIASGLEMGTNPDKISVIPMAEVAKEYMPDILGLNEVREKNGESMYQEKLFADILGYKYHFFAPAIKIEGYGYGNALVSRYPIVDAKIITVPDALEKDPTLPWERKSDGRYFETRCILKATVITPDEKLDVFVTHFGLEESEKKNIMSVLKSELSKKEHRCIVMGDFNSVPTDEHIKELETILKNAQPEDITPELYTFASYEPTMKIDYIMTEKNVDVIKAGSIDVCASDHRPYYAELEL